MKILLIEWVDSSVTGGWRNKREIRAKPASCYSVGMALIANEEVITLVLSGSGDDEYADTMTIPKVAIKRIRELKVKDARQ